MWSGPARITRYVPGLALVVAVATTAKMLTPLLPISNALVVAIALGALVANTYGTPDAATAGLDLHKLLLEVGIVLLGARIAVSDLLDVGISVIVLTLGTVSFGIVFVESLSRLTFDVSRKTGSLLAAGSSICGVSAVIAIAGAVDPDEEQIAYAVATILLFDAMTLVAFPAVGNVLALPERVFGVWAGLSMFSTGPVAAAGFAYGPAAGQWATVTKLVRNSLMGVVAVAYSLYYARADATDATNTARDLWAQFPKFLGGFLVVIAIANSGFLSTGQLTTIEQASDAAFMFAFAGLGFDIQASEMRNTGTQPILLVLVYVLVVGALTLTASLLLV